MGPLLEARALQAVRAAPATPRRGGTLRYGMVQGPASLDPHRFAGAPADVLYGMVYSRLVQLRPDWNGVEADLAQRWSVSPNGKLHTFTLRPGARFHDGSPVTADDVVFSFERILDARTGAYARSFLADVVEGVTAPDPATVRVALRNPYAGLMAVLALPTASILSRRWVSGGGNLSVAMMGSGPMKFVSLEPNIRITLARHEQYFEQGLPYLDGVILQFLPDDTARSTALRNASVDFIDYVPWRDLAVIKGDARLRVYSDSESSGIWAFPNLRRPPLDNKGVRQAINWAVNRDAILRAVFFGNGASMDAVFMPKQSWAYDAEAPKYGYDPDRARDLIRRSGIPGPLRLELLGAVAARHMSANMEVFQANLRDVGFDVQLRLVEFPDLVRRQFASDYQIVAFGGGPAIADPDFLHAYFHGAGVYAKAMGFQNSQIDQLLDEARGTANVGRRRALYRQVYALLYDEAPWFPMTYREQAEASTQRVQGYTRVLGSNWNGIRIAKTWLSA
jgi:peptide/nickel transport system substrate-binding protein